MISRQKSQASLLLQVSFRSPTQIPFRFNTAIAIAVFAIALGAGAANAPPTVAPATAPELKVRFAVEKYRLKNGLTVLIHEDHSSPIVSFQTWFRIGSKNEKPGLTGMAHLFEHMMFKGAKRYTDEQFDTILQANGATNNAFTTQDYTAYHENLPSAKLELVMDIESDRMQNLRIDAENLKSEREVVKEERRMRVDNSPVGILFEAMYDAAFTKHPYHWPVIGYMKDLDNVTVEIAQEFHHKYYAPNNAVVVVAGDVDPQHVRQLVEKYYSLIPAQTIPNEPRIPEPPQKTVRQVFIERDVQNTQFILAYHTPKGGEAETYALDLLANILGNGTSSRLYQRLVYRDQTAAGVSVFNSSLQDSGLFQVLVSLKPNQSFDQVYRSVIGELWRPRNLTISDAELKKAKNQVMKSYVDGLKTVHGKAEALAANEILYGDYEMLFKDLERYNAVTKDMIRNVAKKYLAPTEGTVVVMRAPKKSAAKKGAM